MSLKVTSYQVYKSKSHGAFESTLVAILKIIAVKKRPNIYKILEYIKLVLGSRVGGV